MSKAMVFGTFDIFHPGHRDFFRQAKKRGNYLVVIIARDATVEQVKKQRPMNSEQKRLEEIQESGLADEVVLGNLTDWYAVIAEHRPDVICLGYDQEFFVDKLQEKLESFALEKTKIIRLNPFEPEKYKSSIIAKKGFI